MKTIVRFRFVWVALLLSTALFTACKKNVDPVAPADAASQAAGTYTYAELAYDGKTLPADKTNLKGTIKVMRQTESTVTLDLNIRQKSTNGEFMVFAVEDVEVVDKGNGNLSFVYDSEQVGTLKGNKITINGEDDNNARFTIAATK